jgi:hypothetical protein
LDIVLVVVDVGDRLGREAWSLVRLHCDGRPLASSYLRFLDLEVNIGFGS